MRFEYNKAMLTDIFDDYPFSAEVIVCRRGGHRSPWTRLEDINERMDYNHQYDRFDVLRYCHLVFEGIEQFALTERPVPASTWRLDPNWHHRVKLSQSIGYWRELFLDYPGYVYMIPRTPNMALCETPSDRSGFYKLEVRFVRPRSYLGPRILGCDPLSYEAMKTMDIIQPDDCCIFGDHRYTTRRWARNGMGPSGELPPYRAEPCPGLAVVNVVVHQPERVGWFKWEEREVRYVTEVYFGALVDGGLIATAVSRHTAVAFCKFTKPMSEIEPHEE